MNQTTYQRKALFAGIVGASALLFGTTVSAQQDITKLGIEEMIVTAQKREENIQAIPISISSLSAVDIERRGVNNAQDLVGTIPNMGGFQPPGGKGNISISLRGVSSGSPSNLSIDTNVATYVDGVLLGKMIGTSLDVAELERVEVLRGPQGTLYGRNSTGGAVNFITRKPSGEFGGKITTTVGNYDLWSIKAALDTPTLGTAGRRRRHAEGIARRTDPQARRPAGQPDAGDPEGLRRYRSPGLSHRVALGAHRRDHRRLRMGSQQARRARRRRTDGRAYPARPVGLGHRSRDADRPHDGTERLYRRR
jgi:outer membrane receptor protein involved in Fe transport